MPGLGVQGCWTALRRHLNFFRIHLLFFTLTPLLCSVILYASNGSHPIAYIDALYNSVSAVTVCGLATVNLSQLTVWQQFLLFIQMCVGSPVVVSWFMVLIRRNFFAKKFEYIVRAEAARRVGSKTQAQQSPEPTSVRRSKFTWSMTSLRRRTRLSPTAEQDANEDWSSMPREGQGGTHKKLRTDMIRRMDAPPKRVNPSGWISEDIITPLKQFSSKIGSGPERGLLAEQPSSPIRTDFPVHLTSGPAADSDVHAHVANGLTPSNAYGIPVLGTDVASTSRSAIAPGGSHPASPTSGSLNPGTHSPQLSPAVGMARTTTVEFAPTVTRHYIPLNTVRSENMRDSSTNERSGRQPLHRGSYSRRYPSTGRKSQMSTRNPSNYPSLSNIDQMGLRQAQASQTGFGGFPMPHKLLGMLFGRLFPGTANRLRRTMTIPITTSLSGGELGRMTSISGAGPGRTPGSVPEGSKPVPYISFDAIVGRNSEFQMLTNEQLEELGGVEYRGLNALLWLVAVYHIGTQLISFIVIAPYMAIPKWASDFVPPALVQPVATPWFSLFQVVSSYTNTGLSLVDQSMLPFQTAYPMIIFMIFLILAGNTGFLVYCPFKPILLRFMIWTIAKSISTGSRLYETLHFLLDHPRRCFVYLFPAHQTWFLLSVVVLLNSINFFCFMVLDIGTPEIESIPIGTRFAAGLLQAVGVRASGFAVVPLAALAPAVLVMYVIMMYISVYPIAMSVRSTNVYEEQSLGIFHSDDHLSTAEQAFKTEGSRMAMWGRYLAMHARYQLSFDMWWLALALFLVCTIERDNLINPDVQSWFNIFAIIFELVSAYGSVGLSLGIPNQNYSLCGAFRPLSKLVVCLVMIRGRHRGLPVAIDRAVVLPFEFERAEDNLDPPPKVDERRSSRYSVGMVPYPEGGSTDDAEDGDIAVGELRVGKDEVGEEYESRAKEETEGEGRL